MNPNPYSLIAKLKVADAYLQIASFLFMVFAYNWETYVFEKSIFLLAIEQCLSTLCWIFYLRKKERVQGGTIIRTIFLVVMIILTLIVCIKPEIMIGVLFAMIVIGPILGLSYFIIGLKEIGFYRKLHKLKEGS